MSGIEISIFSGARVAAALFLCKLGWFLIQQWDLTPFGFVWLFIGASCFLHGCRHAYQASRPDEWAAKVDPDDIGKLPLYW